MFNIQFSTHLFRKLLNVLDRNSEPLLHESDVLCWISDTISFLSLQVILKPGRTNLSLEIQTTWWVRTACLCSSTTSEEGDSWPVNECDETVGALHGGGVHTAQPSTNLILSRCLPCPKLLKSRETLFLTRRESEESEGGGTFVHFSFFCFFFLLVFFGAFKACKKKKKEEVL